MTDTHVVLNILRAHDMDVAADDHTLAQALLDMVPDTGEIIDTMRFYGLYYPRERLLKAARAINETTRSNP